MKQLLIGILVFLTIGGIFGSAWLIPTIKDYEADIAIKKHKIDSLKYSIDSLSRISSAIEELNTKLKVSAKEISQELYKSRADYAKIIEKISAYNANDAILEFDNRTK